jgi:hypothetical protein
MKGDNKYGWNRCSLTRKLEEMVLRWVEEPHDISVKTTERESPLIRIVPIKEMTPSLGAKINLARDLNISRGN